MDITERSPSIVMYHMRKYLDRDLNWTYKKNFRDQFMEITLKYNKTPRDNQSLNYKTM